ncbi:MAG: lipocalin family protein [Lentimicrobiaceae bacterium]|nr:lipocalin family protein [Lentimicrobiaceae bacterium]
MFSSCGKDKTNEELLTYSKGWKLSKAVTSPAYTNSKGVTSVDLTKCWFESCEMDDILIFKTDKATSLTSGCDGSKETTGTWSFPSEDPLKLKFRLHYFEDIDGEPEYNTVDVTDLSEDTFEYDFTWKDEDGQMYTFTLTYKHK